MTLKIISLLLACTALLTLLGCKKSDDHCIINGETLYFVTEEEKSEWKDPVAELIGKEADISEGYGCGLFDVTGDGTPELLAHPRGYYGSSGTVTYFIYDISDGRYIGEINSGNDGSLCVYYNTQTESTSLVGQYWLRYGWDQRERFLSMIEYDPSTSEYTETVCLRTFHEISMSQSGEVYPSTEYYVHGQKVTLDEYYSEYTKFEMNFVRIPETELCFVRWDDITDEEDDDFVKAEKMAEALVSSAQKFLDHNNG